VVLDTWESFALLGLVLLTVQSVVIGVSALKEALGKAKDAVVVREQVLSVVAHDLRQPLSALSLRHELMARTVRSGRGVQPQDLDDCQGLFVAIDLLLQNLLDVSKLEAGGVRLSPQPVSLLELANTAARRMQPQAAAKGLGLSVTSLVSRIPPVSMDPHLIERVLVNLLANAVKFTPRTGRVSIEVGFQGGRVSAVVRDTGPGVAETERASLFRKHWQSEKTAHLGSGLGLFICREIIAAHRGTITYESAPAGGSAFRFELPAEAGDG
jgi:signal transduction histidine kinase